MEEAHSISSGLSTAIDSLRDSGGSRVIILLSDGVDFDKSKDGLIPTIVQDKNTKQVLMLAYSNRESVLKSLSTGKATYYSRSRQELWTKGKTSGNTQELVSAKFDCDKDTILYKVNQTGNACHLDRYSCFEDKDFAFMTFIN